MKMGNCVILVFLFAHTMSPIKVISDELQQIKREKQQNENHKSSLLVAYNRRTQCEKCLQMAQIFQFRSSKHRNRTRLQILLQQNNVGVSSLGYFECHLSFMMVFFPCLEVSHCCP